jgi:hypothetical protein
MIGTGIAAPLLIFLSSYSTGTRYAWIALPFFWPGLKLATFIFPQRIHSDSRQTYIEFAMALNVVIIWIILELVVVVFERLAIRRRKIA